MTNSAPAETAFFPGEFLSAGDYAVEQAYQIALQRAGARTLNGWGLVNRLTVTPTGPPGEAVVSSGLAIDSLGRLLLLPESRVVSPPSAPNQVLTIAFAETTLPAAPGAVGAILEAPRLAWQDAATVIDPSLTLVLAAWDGTSLSPKGRVYAGVPAGIVQFENPLTASRATLVAWSASPLQGLRIDSDLMTVSAPPVAGLPAAESSLSVLKGALGVGSMSPQAYLDVLAPNVPLTGPGLLTSFDTVVRGSDARLGRTIHPGDILIVTDREGQPKQSRVTGVTSDTELVTASPLNCVDAPFQYEQALTASIRTDGGGVALNVDRLGNVGLGVEFPMAQLHVAGDIELSGDGDVLAFAGPGQVITSDSASLIDFQTTPASGSPTQTVFSQNGDIRWLSGQSPPPGSPAPLGMALTAAGNLGIGTQAPLAKLDVVGALQLTSGGLVFPDGTVQKIAQASVPVGAIIDWFQGSANQQPPDNFMICSGGVVNDTQSHLHGKVVPNLSNRFVYGAVDDSHSTTPVGSDTHQHNYVTPSHTHGFPHTHPDLSGQTGKANHDDGTAGGSGNAAAGHVHQWQATVGEATTETTQANSDAGSTSTTEPASTLPPFIGLLKLIRIR